MEEELSLEGLGFELNGWTAALCEEITNKIKRVLKEEPYIFDRLWSSPNYYFVSALQIGSVGYLVSKSEDIVQPMGSQYRPPLHIWACFQGISLIGTNELEIVEVVDLKAVVQLLKSLYTTRYIRNEIEPMIQDGKLPLRFPSTNLYFCIGHLYDAHINGWMKYNLYPGQD